MAIPVLEARCDAYKSVAFGSITGSYTALGTVISHNLRILDLTNTTNADVSISFDGTTNNILLPAGSFRLYDQSINGMIMSKNTQVYVKSAGSPSSGAVYLTGWYQKGE